MVIIERMTGQQMSDRMTFIGGVPAGLHIHGSGSEQRDPESEFCPDLRGPSI